jgi:hypothetical protein
MGEASLGSSSGDSVRGQAATRAFALIHIPSFRGPGQQFTGQNGRRASKQHASAPPPPPPASRGAKPLMAFVTASSLYYLGDRSGQCPADVTLGRAHLTVLLYHRCAAARIHILARFTVSTLSPDPPVSSTIYTSALPNIDIQPTPLHLHWIQRRRTFFFLVADFFVFRAFAVPSSSGCESTYA